MPLQDTWQNHFYSINVGPAHFIFFNIDLYYEEISERSLDKQKMIDALEFDLELADSDENREARPWLFCFGHYPLYCGDPGDGGCKGQEHPYYDGMYAEIESLLFKYNVDFFISGHIHGYER